MTTPSITAVQEEILYPDSDGQPMADNTLQFQWIVTIQGNLDAQFRHDANVFVAGDLLWYPVQGHPEVCIGPDVMVAFGRPKGKRGSYKQWAEGGIAPQVVFEILSPRNSAGEMGLKFDFYDLYGVEEYVVYDPERNDLAGYRRLKRGLQPIETMNGWVSPRLGIRFDMSGPEMVLWRNDGQRFLTFVELAAAREQAEARVEQLAARLRALGIDPDH